MKKQPVMLVPRIGLQERLKNYRNAMIDGAVRNIREFGYPDVNTENVFSEYVYSKLFEGMVEQTIGDDLLEEMRFACQKLLEEIRQKREEIKQ